MLSECSKGANSKANLIAHIARLGADCRTVVNNDRVGDILSWCYLTHL